MENKIFSGETSRELWDEINSITDISTPTEISAVLYSFGCAMQMLERKIDELMGEHEPD